MAETLKSLLSKIVLEPKAFGCKLYRDAEGNVGVATAIIVPTKFRAIEDGVQLTWSCSLLESCVEKKCIYSKLRVRNNVP